MGWGLPGFLVAVMVSVSALGLCWSWGPDYGVKDERSSCQDVRCTKRMASLCEQPVWYTWISARKFVLRGGGCFHRIQGLGGMDNEQSLGCGIEFKLKFEFSLCLVLNLFSDAYWLFVFHSLGIAIPLAHIELYDFSYSFSVFLSS